MTHGQWHKKRIKNIIFLISTIRNRFSYEVKEIEIRNIKNMLECIVTRYINYN